MGRNRKRLAPDEFDASGLVPIGSRPLRCIDPAHDEPCETCLEAPSMADEDQWNLHGDPGKRNGDKKLRTLIQMTREWNSPIERAFLANHLAEDPETMHLENIITIIRKKETPRLSKRCMLILARCWGFKSSIWVPKMGGQIMQSRKKVEREEKREAAKKAKVVQSEQERKDTLERTTIEKMTYDLKQVQSYLSLIVEHVSQIGENGGWTTKRVQSVWESISTLHHNMQKLKVQCEECLVMLQQAVNYSPEMLESSPWSHVYELKAIDQLNTEMENAFWNGLIVHQQQAMSLRLQYEKWCCQLHASTLQLVTIAKCEVAQARNDTYHTYVVVAIACIKVYYVLFVESLSKLSEIMAKQFPNGQSYNMNSAQSTPMTLSSNANGQSNAITTKTETPQSAQYANDTLRLLRSLSNDIVMPRSISNEILMPPTLAFTGTNGSGTSDTLQINIPQL